jgi:hypothetical protein
MKLISRILMPLLLFMLTDNGTFAQTPLPVSNLTAESTNSGHQMKVSWSNPYPTFPMVNYTYTVSGPLLSYSGSSTTGSLTFGTEPGGMYTVCVSGTARTTNGGTVDIASSCVYQLATPSSPGGGTNPDPCASFYVANKCESPASMQLLFKWFPPPGNTLKIATVYVRCRVQGSNDAWQMNYASYNTGACTISGLTNPGLYEVEYASCSIGSWQQANETILIEEW